MADQAAPPPGTTKPEPCVAGLRLRRRGRAAAKLLPTRAETRETNRSPGHGTRVDTRGQRPPAPPQHNALRRSVVELLIEDYEAGASTHELAKRYNVRRKTVRDTLRRAGFDPADKGKRAAFSDEQKAEARRLFAGGSTRRELMEMYGVSESTIRRILRTHAP